MGRCTHRRSGTKRARVGTVPDPRRGRPARHDPGGLEPIPSTFRRVLNASCVSGTTRSSGPSPIRTYSAGSAATLIPMRSCIAARLSPTARSVAENNRERIGKALCSHARPSSSNARSNWLRTEAGDGWPEKVTAFRSGMAVHGRYGEPCPVCGAPVQRIRYADNETNYCPRCQTGGRILADRSLSRLLKDDWPRHLDDL